MEKITRKFRLTSISLLAFFMLLSGCSATKADANTETKTDQNETVEETPKEDTLHRLAKDYDHLAWVINEDKTKVVDGVTYDLVALKEQYGDLYPMIEPLSEQEIKDRFIYITKYLVNEAIISPNGYVYPGGLKEDLLGQDFYSETLEFRQFYKKQIYMTSDERLTMFSDYYVDGTSKFYSVTPIAFTSSETQYGIGVDIIEKIPFKDMEWFIRDYMVQVYKAIRMAQDKGLELEFYFDPEVVDK